MLAARPTRRDVGDHVAGAVRERRVRRADRPATPRRRRSAPARARAVARQPRRREAPQPALLVGRDRLQRCPGRVAAPRLDLAEHHHVAVARDDVDLAAHVAFRMAPVARDDRQPEVPDAPRRPPPWCGASLASGHDQPTVGVAPPRHAAQGAPTCGHRGGAGGCLARGGGDPDRVDDELSAAWSAALRPTAGTSRTSAGWRRTASGRTWADAAQLAVFCAGFAIDSHPTEVVATVLRAAPRGLPAAGVRAVERAGAARRPRCGGSSRSSRSAVPSRRSTRASTCRCPRA